MLIAVAGLLLSGVIAAALAHRNALPAWSSNVPVRDATMGCVRFANHYTDIRQAFGMSEPSPACKPPAGWSETAVARAVDAASARLAVDEALRAARRHFHEMLFWFFVLPGLRRFPGESAAMEKSATSEAVHGEALLLLTGSPCRPLLPRSPFAGTSTLRCTVGEC
ncbi:MAG: hypothetical protein JNM54_05330 [Candidatus Accumulibacter sp.]|uniref:hypothetical protein n=1 Tax=Accumulibacter sp. TaxID=2053492 RepID=UPI001A4A459B|nr:hypothetical protein [Accumulibacter sp.]MBL8367319.1 hypothetical protein [Accumulibacter sp.]